MKYFKLIFLLLIISCTESHDNNKKIELFNNAFISLENGDKVLKITPEVKERYLSTFSKSLQIPLFRYIDNKNYELFIGIPFNCSLNEIIAASSDSSGKETKTDSSTFFYSVNKTDSAVIVNYTKLLDKNMVSLIVVSKSFKSDSLLSVQALSKRMHIKE